MERIEPERFVQLQNDFSILSLVYIMPIRHNCASLGEWTRIKDEVQQGAINWLDDDKYLANLEWLGEPMRADQRSRLRKEIADSLADLKTQWESKDAALSKSQLSLTLSFYPHYWPNKDEIIKCSNFISFYIENIIGKAKTALEILDNKDTPSTHTLPPSPDSSVSIEIDIKKPSKKLRVAPPHSFTDLLKNGFTKENLDALLVHMLIKNANGETLLFKRYKLHSVIEALDSEGFIDRTTQEGDQKSLSLYLGLNPTRIKATEGKSLYTAKNKAIRYLTELKKEREKNGSFLVP